MAFTGSTPVRATGSLTLADELDDQDSFRVGDQVYVVATTPDAANEIDIGASETATAANIVAAINGTGTPGTEYFADTGQPTGIQASSADGVITLTADLPGDHGNSLALVNLVGTDVTVQVFQGGAGDIQDFISSVISENQLNAEVIRELSLLLTTFASAASLP